MEKAPKEDDVPDVPGHSRLPRGVRKDPYPQRRRNHYLDMGPRGHKKNSHTRSQDSLKPSIVVFADLKTERSFERLARGKSEDKNLYSSINSAIKEIKQNPFCGIRIQKRLWPKEYKRKYGILNLQKYNLPNGWRIIYTIMEDEVKILTIILEWFGHKKYSRRFKY